MNAKLTNLRLFPLVTAAMLAFLPTVPAQTSNAPAAAKPKESPAELEAKFKAMLTNATLAGRWCLIQDGKMTPDKEDKYTIMSVEKLGGDNWIVYARIQYGERNIVAPVPVQIKWAGDTPVLCVDKLPVPGGGVYTARVLFYDNTYSGTWSGETHGGLLHGTISHGAATNAPPAAVNR